MNIQTLAKKAIKSGSLDSAEIDFLKALARQEYDDLSFPRAMIEELLPEIEEKINELSILRKGSTEEWGIDEDSVLNNESAFNFFKMYFLTDEGRLHEVISCLAEEVCCIKHSHPYVLNVKHNLLEMSFKAAQSYYVKFNESGDGEIKRILLNYLAPTIEREILEVNSLFRRVNKGEFIHPEYLSKVSNWLWKDDLSEKVEYIFSKISPSCLLTAVQSVYSKHLVKVMSLVASRNNFRLIEVDGWFKISCGSEQRDIAKEDWFSYSAATLEAASQGLLDGDAATKAAFDLLKYSRVAVGDSVVTVLVDHPKLCMPFSLVCSQTRLAELKIWFDTGWHLTSSQNNLILNEQGKEWLLSEKEKHKIGFAVLDGCLKDSEGGGHLSRMSLSCFKESFFEEAIKNHPVFPNQSLKIVQISDWLRPKKIFDVNKKISRSERLLRPYLEQKNHQKKITEKIKTRKVSRVEKSNVLNSFNPFNYKPFMVENLTKSSHDNLWVRFGVEDDKNNKYLRSQDFIKKESPIESNVHPLCIYKNTLYSGEDFKMPSVEDFMRLGHKKERHGLKSRVSLNQEDKRVICAL